MDKQIVDSVEGILLRMHRVQAEIDEFAEKRDSSIAFYQRRIADANDNFDTETFEARRELDNLTVELKNFTDGNPPKGRKSHKFAGGTFGYSKQETKFAIGDAEANADNQALLEFVKHGHEDFLRVKESVNWKALKAALDVHGELVSLKDTGEIIPDMRAIPQPDKFTVKLKETKS